MVGCFSFSPISRLRGFLAAGGFTLLLTLAFSSALHSRPHIGILAPRVAYPSQGHEWFGSFLQDELSQQFRFSNRFAVMSPFTARLWQERYDSRSPEALKMFFQQAQLELLVDVKIQKVLRRVGMEWQIVRGTDNATQAVHFSKSYPLDTPDEFVVAMFADLETEIPEFSGLQGFPRGQTWKAVRAFYQWRGQQVPQRGSPEWSNFRSQLRGLVADHPSLEEQVLEYEALLDILEAGEQTPAYVPILKKADERLKILKARQPGNSEISTLLALSYYLQGETLQAKSEAVIANAKNPFAGPALMIYGLVIGRTPQEGKSFIQKGLRLYPFLADSTYDTLPPYHTLIRPLGQWLVSGSSQSRPDYEERIAEGQKYFRKGEFDQAQQVFADLSATVPTIAKPQIYLARIEIRRGAPETALRRLQGLQRQFPEESEVALYLGYAHEKLGQNDRAEDAYRHALNLRPDSPRALLRLSTVLIRRKRYNEAQSFLESLTSKYPDYAVAWWNLGVLHRKLDQPKQAQQAWERALQVEPDNERIRSALMKLSVQLESVSE